MNKQLDLFETESPKIVKQDLDFITRLKNKNKKRKTQKEPSWNKQ